MFAGFADVEAMSAVCPNQLRDALVSVSVLQQVLFLNKYSVFSMYRNVVY
jgi:hypothetical protein